MAGQHSAQEKPGNGNAGRDAVNDERDAGRDDGPQAGCRTGQGRRHALIVAGLFHGRDHDDADRDRRGHGGPGDRREDGAGKDRGKPQPAADVSQQRAREAHQVRREAALVHQVAGQHEERDGEQREGRQAAEDGLNQGGDRDGAADDGIDHGTAAQGDRDGCGDAQQQNKGADEDDHWAAPFAPRPRNTRNSSSVRKNMMKKPVGSAA